MDRRGIAVPHHLDIFGCRFLLIIVRTVFNYEYYQKYQE